MTLLTVAQVAERWGCSPDTVIRKLSSGKLRGFKAGGWRVREDSLEEYEGRPVRAMPAQEVVPDVLGLFL